jgi:outer membrane autotransporter protein
MRAWATGLRLARDWNIGVGDSSGEGARKFSLWGRGDIWREFLGEPATEFSSASGSVPFTVDVSETWCKLGLGAAIQVTDKATFYGNVNYASSFDADARRGSKTRAENSVVRRLNRLLKKSVALAPMA